MGKINFKNLLALVVLATIAACAFCGCDSKSKNPAANAGPDQKVLIGDTVQLDGNSSTGVDNSIWTIVSKPDGSIAVISKQKTLEPTFIADVGGDYEISLSINNGVSADTVLVTAKHVIAKIDNDTGAGSTISTRDRNNTTENVINLEQAGAVLTGTNSRGNITTYRWSEISGPGGTPITEFDGVTLSFSGPTLAKFLNQADKYKWQPLPVSIDDTKMIFKLIVEDAEGNYDEDVYIVYVQDEGTEIKTASGLPNVGLGTTVYMSGPSLIVDAEADDEFVDVTDWTWTISSAPSGSTAKFANTGTDTSYLQVPKFVPDKNGLYLISYSTTSGPEGASGTIWLNVAEWVGVGTVGGATPVAPQCGLCHNGTIEPDITTPWSQTVHATIFENSMATYAGLAPTPYLWQYETVGWDTSASAINGGFDDLVKDASFEFPESGLTWDQFTASHSDLAKLANVQCENCHGPGSQHNGDPLRTSHSFSQTGVCGQCHIERASWINADHNSETPGDQAEWLEEAACTRCHTSKGFGHYVDGGIPALEPVEETGAFIGITCAACHDPHSADNPVQLRLHGNVTMVVDGSTVNAGKAATCYMCHDGFYTYGQPDCDKNLDGVADSVCESTDDQAIYYLRGPHRGPQAAMLEGKLALTDLDGDGTPDFTTENSFHSEPEFTLAGVTGDLSLPTENNKCVTCHMAEGPAINEDGYQYLGGHAFSMRATRALGHLDAEDVTRADSDSDLMLVSACTICHPSMTNTLNRTARADYDGDGSVEGIQDEIKGLLLALSLKIKAVDTTHVKGSSGTKLSGGIITPGTLSWNGANSSLPDGDDCGDVTSTDYQPCVFADADDMIKRAVWNQNSAVRDYSYGAHNMAYEVQYLQKTYTVVSEAYGGNSFAVDYPNAAIR
jgi:hypothetical protein